MPVEVKNQIIKTVDKQREEIVAFLQQLIQINSVTGQEGAIQEFISQTMSSLDLVVDKFEPDVESLRDSPGFVEPELPFEGRPNVVGVWKGSSGERSLLLNGHVDTVPFTDCDGWIEDPLSGSIKDGMIWGRGASDMKGGMAAMIMAISVLKTLCIQPKGEIILESVVDEERTGLGTLACVHRGYKAEAGLCCETSDLEIMPACIGRMWFTIRLIGKPTGISARWKGVSAIDKAIKIIEAVEDLERIRIEDLHHPLYPDNRGALPCAVTMFNSGTFPSISPTEAILRGSMGLMPYEEIEDAKKQLEAQIIRVAETDPWLRNNHPEVSIAGGYLAEGAEIPMDHPILQTVATSFKFAIGKEPTISGRMGAADTRFLIRNGSTPTVIFGPGVTAQMHATNEHIPIDNLLSATKVIALTIYEWCC